MDILCSVGADRVIRYVSPASFDILGRQPEEMVGKAFADFVFSEDISAFEVAEATSTEAGAADFLGRLRLTKKDLTPVWISITARCLRDPVTNNPQEYVLVMRDIAERKVLEEKLSALAMTDDLTGLWNRRAFDQALRREWKRTAREESQLSLLLLDLDHFKPLNDQYGHPLGDECLAAVASAVSDTVRATDVVCRWGGDEVAIILPATDSVGAVRTAEKVRSAVEVLRFRPSKNPSESVFVTASIGVATAMPQPDGTITAPHDLLLAADKALYKAKREGHNRVVMAPGVPTRGVDAPEAMTTKTANVGFESETPKKHSKDGRVRDGQPSGIDSL